MEKKKIVIIFVLLVATACMLFPLRFQIWSDRSFSDPQFYLLYGAILIAAIILVIDFIRINRKKD